MRIGIDARELVGRPTGVGRYLAGLLREWSRGAEAGPHEFTLYAHAPADAFGSILSAGIDTRSPPARHSQHNAWRARVLPGSGGTLWEQRDLARAIGHDGIEVLFSPAYSTPLMTGVPRVVALHDLSFAARPEWFRWREGVRRRGLARHSAAAAQAVVTISRFSKREIVARFGIDGAKIHVVPPGIDRPAGGGSPAGVPLPGALLYVGSVFNRRHVPDLIRAFARVVRRHPDATFDVVGDNRTHPREDLVATIAREQVVPQVRLHDYVPDAQLGTLYGRARGFAFLSEYEGLGLTPLEALAAGVPSVLLDTAVARESCGDAALYVATTKPDDVAPIMERLLYDGPTHQALLSVAPAVLAQYDWARAAAETLRVITGARSA
jgi:glycosyltransferase involved in cell wall biosynthesis